MNTLPIWSYALSLESKMSSDESYRVYYYSQFLQQFNLLYNIPKYSDRHAWVNSVNPDQSVQEAIGLEYVPFTIQPILSNATLN